MSHKIWRGVESFHDHPDNNQGGGGARISTIFVRLDCGHTRTFPKSKTPSGNSKVRCPECERATPTPPTPSAIAAGLAAEAHKTP